MKTRSVNACGFWLAAALAATAAVMTVCSPPLAEGAVANDQLAMSGVSSPLLRQVPAQVLKVEFLKCDRAANEGQIDVASISHCSFVYDELRVRVFDGDFDELLAWWGQNRH